MPADAIAISDAVVAALNGATLSQSFTASRGYVIVLELPMLAGLKVTVIPAMVAVAAFDLSPRRSFDWSIGIAVQKRLPSPAVEFVDPLMTLSQEIVDLFRPGAYLGDKATKVHGVEVMPACDPNKLDTQGLFESIITLTVRVTR